MDFFTIYFGSRYNISTEYGNHIEFRCAVFLGFSIRYVSESVLFLSTECACWTMLSVQMYQLTQSETIKPRVSGRSPFEIGSFTWGYNARPLSRSEPFHMESGKSAIEVPQLIKCQSI